MAKSINRLMAELINDDGDVKLENLDEAPRGLDSAAVDDIAQDAAIQVYDSLGLLPITGLTAGDQAYVSSNTRLYVSNGSGWYNVALVNLTPTMSLDQSGTIVLSTEGVATTVTITAQDSDNPAAILSYSVESDGNGIGNYTLSQDSSVFTITPLTEDSGASASTFTLTFKTTDNINTATSDLGFSLTFSNFIDSSAETVLLMKATGNSATNSAITYLDSDNTSQGFSEVGNPAASTFTPYRSAGYSMYFDRTTDYLSFTADANFSLDSDFTIEGWIRPESITLDTQHPNILILGSNTQIYLNSTSSYISLWNGSADVVKSANSSITLNDWHHFAAVRSGTDTAMFLNGSRVDTSSSDTTTYGTSSGTQYIGNFNGASGGGDYEGYIKDLRVVNGTAVYDPTQTTCTVPTRTLEVTADTKLLVGNKPFIGNSVLSGPVVTESVNRGVHNIPYSPYDQEPWAADDHGGSVHFDGSDALENVTTAIGTSDFTLEGWIYVDTDGPSNYAMIFDNRSALTTGVYGWYQENDDKIKIAINSTTFVSDNEVTYPSWHHWAIVRNSNACTFYLNGRAQTSNAGTSITTDFTGTEFNIGRNSSVGSPANGDYFYGNQADFRYSKSAVYTADFMPPTAPLSHTANTHLLMNNKSDANIYDATASTSFDLIGNAASSTTQRKFTTSSSVYFDGTGDYIDYDYANGNADLYSFGTGDFTIECWVYFTSIANGSSNLQIFYHTGGTTSSLFFHADSNQLSTGTSNVYKVNEATSFSINTWYHLATTRANGTSYVFRDGVLLGSGTADTTNYTSTGNPRIGANTSGGQTVKGYMQDLRVTKGLARYTATFTPPTAEFEL